MYDHIAFLRAINVGGHTVRMDHLRSLFDALGFSDVATFIASGNVIFRSPEGDTAALEARIERHLLDALGYEVATFLRSFGEVQDIAGFSPFPDADWKEEGAGLYVGFLRSAPPAKARRAVIALSNAVDEIAIHGRELYWLARRKFGGATITGAGMEKQLGMPMTLRGMNTVTRLADRCRASG